MESNQSWEILALGPKGMGETLLTYARPLVNRLPRHYTSQELNATLRLAAAVWNARLVRDIGNAVAHLDTMPPRLRVPRWKGLDAIRRLLKRRRRFFSWDDHFIAAVDVHAHGGEMHVTAIGLCPDPRCCGPQARA
jgi:hypothetical protein